MSGRRGAARCGRMAALVAACVLVLTGCLRTEMGVHIEGDGAGRIDLEVYFDEVSLQQAGLSGEDLVKLVETATTNIDGAEISAVNEVGAKGVRMSLPFDDYRQLTQSLTNGSYQGYSLRLFQTFDVTEGEDGKWSMTAAVDPVGFRAVLAQIPANLSGSASQVDADTEFVFAVTLPGKVLRSNATKVDGGTARWDLNGDAGAQTFTMENEPSGLSTIQMALIGVGALIVVGLLLMFLTAAGSKRRHRRKGKKISVDTNHPQSWAPVGPSTDVQMPNAWSSPPPYSSHGWGEAAPTSPPVAGEPAPVGGITAPAPVAAPGPPPAPVPVGPPVAPSAEPPTATAPTAGGAAWAPTRAVDPEYVGPPVLPAGFVPTPDNAFPETHSYSQPTEPVVPQPHSPAPAPVPAAPPSGPSPSAGPSGPGQADPSGRPGPPPLPEGFVPDAPIAFPDTHSAGPAPGTVPPPFQGEVPDLPPPAPAADEPPQAPPG